MAVRSLDFVVVLGNEGRGAFRKRSRTQSDIDSLLANVKSTPSTFAPPNLCWRRSTKGMPIPVSIAARFTYGCRRRSQISYVDIPEMRCGSLLWARLSRLDREPGFGARGSVISKSVERAPD